MLSQGGTGLTDRVRAEEHYARDPNTKPTRTEAYQSQNKQADNWKSWESRIEADKQEASRNQVDEEQAGQGGIWQRDWWVNGIRSESSHGALFRVDYRFRFFFGGCVTAQSGQYQLTLLGGALRIPTHS